MNGRSRNQNLIYIFAIVGVLFAIYILYGLLTAGVQAYIALIAGAMLLIGNFPDLMRALQQRLLGNAMMNSLIGLALISYFLGSAIGALQWLFFLLAVVLLLAAAPLMLNKAGVARAYMNAIRNFVVSARNLVGSRQRTL